MTIPTDKEIEKLIPQLRENLSDLDLDSWRKGDLYLVDWIKFGGYNLKKAEIGLRTSLKWSWENKMDSILEENLPFQEFLPYKLNGLDNHGWPVLIAPFGKWEMKKLLEKETEARVLRYLLKMVASIENQLKMAYLYRLETFGASFTSLYGGTAICDFKGLSFSHISSIKCIRVITKFVTAVESNFPRYGYSIHVIHVNPVVRALMKIIAPFCSKHTLGQMKRMGQA